MDLNKFGHLTYCTNIHPGETWEEVFKSLINHVLPLKNKLAPLSPFGIGLRLSNIASVELAKENNLSFFKKWLNENGLYVFTMNGFPYGGFHGVAVKDRVHYPDWTTPERLSYTLRLSKILAEILPEDMEGGISTSPISYKPWLEEEKESTERVMNDACNHLFLLIEELEEIKRKTGKIIHIDIEPEPDGLIENADELVDFFNFYLIPDGKTYLKKKLAVTSEQAKNLIYTHIRACYDVCHHALVYESATDVFKKYEKANIKIGKIQISAALKVIFGDEMQRTEALNKLKLFQESTYLHQVVERNIGGGIRQYTDLPFALKEIYKTSGEEWRIHFHVPIFVSEYGILRSTQEDIVEVLKLQVIKPVTQHLEVETYTWEVLPEGLKEDLISSIQRELEWVRRQFI